MEFIAEEILKYCEDMSSPEAEVLQELNRETYAKVLNPRMLSGHLQGRFLAMLSQMLQPKTILEIGTYTGYSALCLCEGLQPEGTLITIDINDELESFSKQYFSASKWASQIIQKTGNALEIIPLLPNIFDLVFIDADKEEYSRYYDLIIDKVRLGGIIIADNVLWSGHVLKPAEKQDLETRSIAAFNSKVRSDDRVSLTMLPIRDGLSLIRKK
ncbi:MAG: O-methyltransferase [Bacteroidetes bacterium]|nr:O-methyltransferase [Bacteroidota bacterium]